MKRLKTVQIGAMHDHSGLVFDTIRHLPEEYEVVGYAVPEGETVANPVPYEGAERLTVEEALHVPGLDAAIIETSEQNLTKYSLMAAQKGLAVHMDKPGGIGGQAFETLIQTVKENATVFHTGYMYRYNPYVLSLMEDIRAGKLGQIYSVEAQMSCMHPENKRQWLDTFPGGMLFFLGCHLIDLVYAILGEPEGVLPLSFSTGIDHVTAKDYGMAVLKYPNQIGIVKASAVEPGGFMRRSLCVCGSKGTVELRPFEVLDGKTLVHTDKREVFSDLYNWKNDGEKASAMPFDRYQSMMIHFAEYVRGEKQNPWSADYELGLYKLLLRCAGIN